MPELTSTMQSLALTQDQLAAITEKVAHYLTQVGTETGHYGAVIPLSGGMDTGALAFVAKRAFGDALVAVTVTEDGVSLEGDVLDASEIANMAGIQREVVSINEIMAAYSKRQPRKFFGDFLRASSNLLKSRVRTSLLYFNAEALNFLVLSSLTKTDFLLGYMVKYGDSAADVYPFAQLYKTQVKQLAEYLGVPQRVTRKPPSQGLWQGQSDEMEIGLKVAQIDELLFLVNELQVPVEGAVASLKVDGNRARALLQRADKNREWLKVANQCPIFPLS